MEGAPFAQPQPSVDEEIINSLKEADRNPLDLSIGQVEKSFRYCSVDLSDADVQRLMVRFDPEEASRFDMEKFFKFAWAKYYWRREQGSKGYGRCRD